MRAAMKRAGRYRLNSRQSQIRHILDFILLRISHAVQQVVEARRQFFEMFDQHANRIVEAAHAFSMMVANYSDVKKTQPAPPRSR